MTPNIQQMSADELGDLLIRAADAYYNTSTTILTDDMFDLAKDRLEKIAPNHPALKQVGAPVQQGKKVDLPFYMGSLDKIRDDPKALDKWKTTYKGQVVLSDKLDGNSGMLVYYANGTLALYSRGDGSVGQDVTNIIPYIQAATVPHPTKLPATKVAHGITYAIRGELIISKNNWKKISDKGANARNVVAGVMHTKTPEAAVAKHVEFVAYEMVYPRMNPSAAMKYMADLGFHVVENTTMSDTTMSMDSLSNYLMRRRADSPYEIDGIVVAHDEEHKIMKGKNPKYAFAFKTMLTHEEAEVIVSHVEWNISKDGYYKPTVHFAAISLNGVKIQRATGFNGAFIKTNKIGPGARVVIVRSGDVIPHIVRVLSPSGTGSAQMPEGAFEWNDTHVDIMVPKGDAATPEQNARTLEHFVNTLDIDHVGGGTIKKFVEAGFDTIPKFLAMTKADILTIDGFKELSADKISKSIAKVRASVMCADMMAASNIFGRGFGKRKIEMIIDALPEILKKKTPSLAELKKVPGVGGVTATGFLEGLPKFFTLMDDCGIPCRIPASLTTANAPNVATAPAATMLSNAAAAPLANVAAPLAHPAPANDLEGKSIVFTGFRNKDWEAFIKASGGKLSTSVSGKTHLVVAADPNDDSGKMKDAREKGIPIISKDAFAKKYKL